MRGPASQPISSASGDRPYQMWTRSGRSGRIRHVDQHFQEWRYEPRVGPRDGKDLFVSDVSQGGVGRGLVNSETSSQGRSLQRSSYSTTRMRDLQRMILSVSYRDQSRSRY